MFARLLSIVQALLMGALLLAPIIPAAQASENAQQPGMHQDAGAPQGEWRPNPERMRALIKARLDKLSARLELTASQQTAWNAFARSVEALAERPSAAPGANADAATIAHYRADLAAGFAKKLAVIADTTGGLQTVLNDKQRKTFNEEYRRMRPHGHRCGHAGDQGKNGRRDDGTYEGGDDQAD